MERESFKSRLGFLLVSAGCAIGIGNVWRFPFVVGQNGGGFFVLVYLVMLVVLGLPVLTMELAVGRASRKSAVQAYQVLEKPGQKWHIHGWFCMLGCCLLMMYYTTVTGWMVDYFYKFLRGDFVAGMGTEEIGGVYSQMLSSPGEMTIFMVIVVVLGFLVCSFGVQKGLERITKVMMIALLAIMVALAVHSFFMPGAKEGLRFFLVPDFARMKSVGIVSTLVGAMNQAFFTLSLGVGAMAIFGSYIGRDHTLLGESVRVVALDTFVAITAGLIIFPACYSYGVDPDAGPNLIFVTLPNIFANMPLGRLWGSLFFIFMAFAALSTVLAVFEEITACTQDLFGWGRKKACIVNGILLFVLSLPCCLGFNLLSFIQPLGEGSTIMDLEDFLVSNLILPLGSLVMILFCTTKKGWGWDNYITEANTGKGLRLRKFLRGYMTYVLPAMVLVLFVIGIVRTFLPG